MKKTANYNLLKPEKKDFYNVDDFNQNADTIDQALKRVDKKVDDAVEEIRGEIGDIDLSDIDKALDKKVDKIAGKGLSTNDFTNADKQDIATLQSDKEALIKNATAKTTLVDADTIPLSDSAAVNGTKKITWANLKAVMKSYFDTLYNKYTHPTYTARSAGLYKTTVDGTGHVSAVAAVAKADITALGIPGQDTVYTHPSYDGYYHMPAGGGVGDVIKRDIYGTAVWRPATEKSYGEIEFTDPVAYETNQVTKYIAIGSGKRYGQCVISYLGTQSGLAGIFITFDTDNMNTLVVGGDGQGRSGYKPAGAGSRRFKELVAPAWLIDRGFDILDVYIAGESIVITFRNREGYDTKLNYHVDWEVW